MQEVHDVKLLPLNWLEVMEVAQQWLAVASRAVGGNGGRCSAAARASSRAMGEMALSFVEVLTEQRVRVACWAACRAVATGGVW
jgi:hypothetical protein